MVRVFILWLTIMAAYPPPFDIMARAHLGQLAPEGQVFNRSGAPLPSTIDPVTQPLRVPIDQVSRIADKYNRASPPLPRQYPHRLDRRTQRHPVVGGSRLREPIIIPHELAAAHQ